MIDPAISDDAPKVTERTLRQFAALSILFFGSLAVWQGLIRHRTGLAAVLAVAVVFPGLTGLAWPKRIRTIYNGLLALTMPIGFVVSFVVLAVFFYVVITPLGVVLRVAGRDRLHVRRQDRPSHWVGKADVTDLASYARQS
jgi:hypothetical protein